MKPNRHVSAETWKELAAKGEACYYNEPKRCTTCWDISPVFHDPGDGSQCCAKCKDYEEVWFYGGNPNAWTVCCLGDQWSRILRTGYKC